MDKDPHTIQERIVSSEKPKKFRVVYQFHVDCNSAKPLMIVQSTKTIYAYNTKHANDIMMGNNGDPYISQVHVLDSDCINIQSIEEVE